MDGGGTARPFSPQGSKFGIDCNRTPDPDVCQPCGTAAESQIEDAGVPTTNFTDLYSSSFARLVGQVTVVTADRAAAEEAVQEAFGRLWKRWESVSAYERPEAWVRRVAINLAISRWRRLRRLRPLGATVAVAPEDDVVTRHDLRMALRTIPVRHRHALLLHYVVGLPVADVAREMGVPEGTVKSWLFRGRDALQRSLGREEAPRG
jgi:RNA polymerase sigma-70 factor (ECF subfamily)